MKRETRCGRGSGRGSVELNTRGRRKLISTVIFHLPLNGFVVRHEIPSTFSSTATFQSSYSSTSPPSSSFSATFPARSSPPSCSPSSPTVSTLNSSSLTFGPLRAPFSPCPRSETLSAHPQSLPRLFPRPTSGTPPPSRPLAHFLGPERRIRASSSVGRSSDRMLLDPTRPDFS